MKNFKGLGDLVEWAIHLCCKPLELILKRCGYRVYPPPKKLKKPPCGPCAARKAMLNKAIPFPQKKTPPENASDGVNTK